MSDLVMIYQNIYVCINYIAVKTDELSLPFDQFRKDTVLGDQFLVCAVFGNLAFMKDQDTVTMADGRQSVCDNNTGAFHLIQGI